MTPADLRAKANELVLDVIATSQGRYGSEERARASLTAFVEALSMCADALQLSRGQWIHSINSAPCLAALSRLEELTK